MERINHVNAAISLSCTNLFLPQSLISKFFTFTIKFSCYIWNWDTKNNVGFFFFLLRETRSNLGFFLFKTQWQWIWHKPHPKTTTTSRSTSVMSLVLLKCLRPKLPLGAMIFFQFLRGFSYFFIWESVNTLTRLIPGVYSEFDLTHFRTHWLEEIHWTRQISAHYTKLSAFVSVPG